MKAVYNIYKRTIGGKKVLYVKIPAEGEAYKHISVMAMKKFLGVKAAHLSHASKAGADMIVRLYLQQEKPGSGQGFLDYLKGFWSADSDYIKAHAMRGRVVSAKYLENNQNNIKAHIEPFFTAIRKKNIDLNNVTTAQLEKFLLYLSDKGLSGRTINAIMQAVTVPLNEAKRLKKIIDNPAEGIKKLPEKKQVRKIFTPDEVREFFIELSKGDPRYYAVNMLSATTGMRLGECVGLLKENVHDTWIEVKTNYQGDELKRPKWGSIRNVPIPSKTQSVLSDLSMIPGIFVFSGSSPDKPMNKRMIQNNFVLTCHAIGISEEERKERALTFHAWRHFYNTMLRGHIPDYSLRMLTGHKSEEMTDKYTAVTDEQVKAVADMSEKIFE